MSDRLKDKDPKHSSRTTHHLSPPSAPSLIRHRYSLRNRGGFTLIEVTLVMAIIGLIAGLAVVFFSRAVPSVNFNATVRDMLSTMRQAKALAQLNGKSRTVMIDLDARSFGIEGYAGKEIPSGIHVKVSDSLSGEIIRGKCRVVFRATGAAESLTIKLWDAKREAVMEMDPVVGLMVLK